MEDHNFDVHPSDINSKSDSSTKDRPRIRRPPQLIRILLLGVLGLFLLVMSIPGLFGNQQSDNGTTKNLTGLSESGTTSDYSTMEGKLEQALLKLDGIQQAQVILSTAGSNQVYGQSLPTGLVIFIAGDETRYCEEDIISACEVLFGLPVHKIKIMKMKGNET